MSAGEVSGDHYVAVLHGLLRAEGFLGRIYGLCGEESEDAGVEALWSNERLHILGVSEVFGSLRGILSLMGEMYREVIEARPEVVVVVDSPDFHLPLIRRLRRNGYRGRIVYVSPPAVWAWRSSRSRDLAAHVDECLPLFKFEHDYLENAGCRSGWIGHPFVDEAADWKLPPEQVFGAISGPGAQRVAPERLVALMPGSRGTEIDNLYGPLSAAYELLASRGWYPVFSIAPGLSPRARERLLARLDVAGQLRYEGSGHDLMAASSFVVGTSGTTTMQALLLQRYMIVLYKLGRLSGLVGRLLLRNRYFSVPNILAGEMLFPELIQGRATGSCARAAVAEWLDADDAFRGRKLERLRALLPLLGRSGVYAFWASRILEGISCAR